MVRDFPRTATFDVHCFVEAEKYQLIYICADTQKYAHDLTKSKKVNVKDVQKEFLRWLSCPEQVGNVW